jgi:polyhydroxybutyrate depolymerase
MTTRLATMLSLLTLLSGCLGGKSGTPVETPEVPDSKVLGTKAFPAKSQRDSLLIGGTYRTWYLVPPKPADSTQPVELVFYFHGYGGSGVGSGQGDPGTPGRVTVYPDGVVQTWWQNALGWDNRNNTTPDIQFIRALLDTLLARHRIDSKRVYATGFSWGGWMANAVGCALGDRLAGMVSAAGGGPEGSAASCATSLPVAILHATNDGAEPQSSGLASRDFWKAKNGCSSSTTPVGTHGCIAYTGCTKPVLWCSHADGHSAPSWWLEDAWKGFGK